MPCLLNFKVGKFNAAGVFVPHPNATIKVRATTIPVMSNEDGTGFEPLDDDSRDATTDTNGAASSQIPKPSESRMLPPDLQWSITLPNGFSYVGPAPENDGPLTIDNLVENEGWALASNEIRRPIAIAGPGVFITNVRPTPGPTAPACVRLLGGAPSGGDSFLVLMLLSDRVTYDYIEVAAT